MDTTARKAKSDSISVGQSLSTAVSSSLYVFVTLMTAQPSSVSRTSLARNEMSSAVRVRSSALFYWPTGAEAWVIRLRSGWLFRRQGGCT
jgi:hypothetical protein